ncbi:30S ribosome-binding factor RbfA [Halioxenophilus sp. WMMB6]|uniref:30S ribosome-binding factor RbfA n=1 Tax=Halioxenophilus sp. WMMB6 TaxID=3073815 RepID=UPI00295EBDC8|nr:30S ribosome-binding factor RbfA [Halioxenophilus sp. WMMB6]
MAKEFSRTDRLADALQRLLAHALQFEVRDPRVGMVNINEVVVSRDLSYAKVYVTFVDRDTDQQRQEALHALNNAAGFLRSLAAKQLDIRVTPRLQFIFDETSTRGQALSNLIDKAVASDRAHHSDESSDE